MGDNEASSLRWWVEPELHKKSPKNSDFLHWGGALACLLFYKRARVFCCVAWLRTTGHQSMGLDPGPRGADPILFLWVIGCVPRASHSTFHILTSSSVSKNIHICVICQGYVIHCGKDSMYLALNPSPCSFALVCSALSHFLIDAGPWIMMGAPCQALQGPGCGVIPEIVTWTIAEL